MAWSPAPLSITDVTVTKSGTALSITIQGTSFDANDDVFLIQTEANALELIANLIQGKDAPDKGIIRADAVTLRNPSTITCTADVSKAKKGKYKLVLDQIDNNTLEVAIGDTFIDVP